MNWTTPEDITASLLELWANGRLLGHIVDKVSSRLDQTGGGARAPESMDPAKMRGAAAVSPPRGSVDFPLTLRLRTPTAPDLGRHYGEVKAWVKNLETSVRAGSRDDCEILWGETNHRLLGRNALPKAVIVPTVEHALARINMSQEAAQFEILVEQTLRQFPELHEWIKRKPLLVLREAAAWNGILAVVQWIRAHPRPQIYLRQVDVPGVDTKFIEPRKALLSELLDIVLPRDAFDPSRPGASHFTDRYGFLAKPTLIRFRIVDPIHCIAGLTDLSVRADEFAHLTTSVERVFVVENEVNGLAFPSVPSSLVIFGLGYAVALLSEARWLRTRSVHYWGDLDTHGFSMLDQLRAALPNVTSLLMDRDTLMSHQHLWAKEERPFVGDLERLTAGERALYDDLRFDRLGRGVRLEQERLPFGFAERAVKAAATTDCDLHSQPPAVA